MPPIFKTYVSYREINDGKTCSTEEFRDRLASYSLNPVLRGCSIVNTRLGSWTGKYDFKFHEPLVRATFKREIAEKIIASGRLAFHRHQLLYVAQEALRCCTNNGRPIELRELGSLFLMASDQLHIAQPEPTNDADKLLYLISILLPTCEAN